jgi:alkaline phosphatase D
VCTSITSGGNGADTTPGAEAVLAANPHITFRIGQRGEVRTRFAGEDLRADSQVVQAGTTAGSPVSTRASLVVPDREPALQPVCSLLRRG